MTGILIVAHGSRERDTDRTLERLREMVEEKFPGITVAEAYMEFRPLNIEAGLLALAEQGIDDIKVIPYFLFEGIHIKEDIPQEIEKFCNKHPGIRVTLGKTLGVDSRLAEVVSDRISEML